MKWEPLNCCSFLDKIYYKLHENELEISLKIVYERIWAFKTRGTSQLKVIRHVFGFGIEFLENKDIGIFGHFIVIDFIKRYSYHAYFSPISTS